MPTKRVSAINTADDTRRKHAAEAYELACDAVHAVQELIDLHIDMRRQHPDAQFVDTNALRDAEATLTLLLGAAWEMRGDDESAL